MKTLKNHPLLSIICLSLLAATIATAEESLEDIRRQAELGYAATQPYSDRILFDTEGNLIGIVTSKLADENTKEFIFATSSNLALEI